MTRGFYAWCVGAAIVIALMPWIIATVANHGPLQVPPEVTDDAAYYYTQMHDVALGYPFIGNPYYKEYRDEPATSFFGAEWIASAPLLVGIPLVPSILVDAAFGFAIFAILFVAICTALEMPRRWIIAGLVFAFAAAYWLLIRPVSMQIVFPCFLFFFVSYLWWLKNPSSRRAQIALIISSALAFYVYTYLWQIVAVSLALVHLLFLTKERRRYLPLLFVDVGTFVLALPVIWYTYVQIHQPWYWETLARTGLVETHTFGSSTIIVAAIVALSLLAVWFMTPREKRSSPAMVFFVTTGVAIIATASSNIITGKDVETAIHIVRFAYVWAALALAYALSARFGTHRITLRSVYGLSGICLVGAILFFGYDGIQAVEGLPGVAAPSALASQAYAAPLLWLQQNTPPGSVVFADDSFSDYVPLMTDDYVLFDPDGEVYLMSDSDAADRYLASRIFDNLTLTDIENDYRLYAGAGNADDAPATADRLAKLCDVFIRHDCPPQQTGVSLAGTSYFENLYAQYQEFLPFSAQTLARYDVSYIVKDTLLDPQFTPEKLPGTHLVATVGRFEIYSFEVTSTAVRL